MIQLIQNLLFCALHKYLVWRAFINIITAKIISRSIFLLVALVGNSVLAQTAPAVQVMLTPPAVNFIDSNFVSVQTGQPQFDIPAVQLGDVSFTASSYRGHFNKGGVNDQNYGRIAVCSSAAAVSVNISGFFDCAVPYAQVAIQPIYGQERAIFTYQSNGTYLADAGDGSTFVDNGNTCVWTKKDGTIVEYVAFHVAGEPMCRSQNISRVISPNGVVSTYYYYGSFSTTNQSPIISIATNTGYLLKYNYPSTPTWGSQTSVTAINRSFEACDPAAVSCSLTQSWPIANLNFQDKMMNVSDSFPSLGVNYNPMRHYIFTIETAAHERHIFELDSYTRVISYQPPKATIPTYSYNLCSLLNADYMVNCMGVTFWNRNSTVYQYAPLMWDLVESVLVNGQRFEYNHAIPGPSGGQANYTGIVTAPGVVTSPGGYTTPTNGARGDFAVLTSSVNGGGLAYTVWGHAVNTPLGRTMGAVGNATPGLDMSFGPIDSLTLLDGTQFNFERNRRNNMFSRSTPTGVKTTYDYGLAFVSRGNLERVTTTPIAGSNLTPVVTSQSFPASCTNIKTCNKPDSVTDAKGNVTNFTYDPTHGGVLTVTSPAVNGIRAQTRRTYTLRNAWYKNSAGVMTKDSQGVWLLATESYCIKSAASPSANGCTLASDEVVTTYEYGADSGPNNLTLRGKSVTADGQTLRTCIGHDRFGNKIWEALPKANLASCSDY